MFLNVEKPLEISGLLQIQDGNCINFISPGKFSILTCKKIYKTFTWQNSSFVFRPLYWSILSLNKSCKLTIQTNRNLYSFMYLHLVKMFLTFYAQFCKSCFQDLIFIVFHISCKLGIL